MVFFGNLGKKIDYFILKAEEERWKNINKSEDGHTHDACDDAHCVAKRSVDALNEIGAQSATGSTAYVIGASEGELTLVGGMIERDYHHAIGF